MIVKMIKFLKIDLSYESYSNKKINSHFVMIKNSSQCFYLIDFTFKCTNQFIF